MPEPSEKRILVVDDDESIVHVVEFALKREGFRTATGFDGQQALERIEQDPPDLVILDLMMPRYGGFEVLRKLQAGPHARLPIVVMSGRVTDPETRELLTKESNVVEFLDKPVKPPQLLAVVHRILHTTPRTAPPA